MFSLAEITKFASNTKQQELTINLIESIQVPNLTKDLSSCINNWVTAAYAADFSSQSHDPNSPKSVQPHLLHQVSIKHSSFVEQG